MNGKDIVIVGAGEHGRMMLNFFKINPGINVLAFAVEEKYYNQDTLEGVPVLTIEKLIEKFPPDKVQLFVAVTFYNMNI